MAIRMEAKSEETHLGGTLYDHIAYNLMYEGVTCKRSIELLSS